MDNEKLDEMVVEEELSGEVMEDLAEQAKEEAVPKTGILLYVEKMSEELWEKWSIACGVLMGVGATACLFLIPESEGFLPMNMMMALFLAMILPNVLENRLERRAPAGRTALLISMASSLAVFFLAYLITGKISLGG